MEKLNIREKMNIYFLTFFVGGVVGFIYETIFYLIDLGYLVKRGSTFGPWIPIYGFGAVFILILLYKYKKNPFKVFLYSCLVAGILEFLTGYILDIYFNTRLWNYYEEILNFGNIGGYVCLRSILLFGFAGCFLTYSLVPLFLKIKSKLNVKVFNVLCFSLAFIFFFDILINLII